MAAGPTTSIREEPSRPDIIKRHRSARHGQGGMGDRKPWRRLKNWARVSPRHRRRGAVLRAGAQVTGVDLLKNSAYRKPCGHFEAPTRRHRHHGRPRNSLHEDVLATTAPNSKKVGAGKA